MTTKEYLEKELRRVQISFDRAKKKPGVVTQELSALTEKEFHLRRAILAVEIAFKEGASE